jgi:hypothetical protein
LVLVSLVGTCTFVLPITAAHLAVLAGARWWGFLTISSAPQAAQLQVLKAHHDEEFLYVMAFFAMIWVLILAFMPRPLQVKPLGGPRKRFAFALIIVGLMTFFLPIVTLDPPLLNRAHWSPFHILSAVYAGALPVARGHFDEVLVEIALLYVLMILALGAVYLLASPKPLTVISFLGFVVSSAARFWHLGFLFMFDYWAPNQVKIGLTGWILPWVMPALLALCFANSLDIDDDITEATV